MKAMVIYDSRYGTTEQVARAVAENLTKTIHVQVVPAYQAVPADLRDVDVLVIGCPARGPNMTRAVEAYLAVLPVDIIVEKPVAVFDVGHYPWRWLAGTAADTIAKRLAAKGARLILPPESFYTETPDGPLAGGELRRVAYWARAIQEQMQMLPL